MRLLSYNIHKGIGGRDRLYRIERIVDVIGHEVPDLVCLQEVDHNVRRSDFHDQATDLTAACRYAANLYQMNVSVQQGGYGNLLLSRWPFLDRHQVSLKLSWRKSRGAQMVVVDTPQGLLHLVNWHLGLIEHERHWQVARLLEHELFLRSAHLPTIIAGDTNDWRNTLHAGPFRRHGFTQATAPIAKYRSFPATLPVASLDKLFVRGGVVIERARLVRTKLARAASDHLPLVVDFHLEPRPEGVGRADEGSREPEGAVERP